MQDYTRLGYRTIIAYARLARDVAALTFTMRSLKPNSAIGELTQRQCNVVIRSANRVFRRELGLPRFCLIDPAQPLTAADLTILVARLTLACKNFEERYEHLTVPEEERAWYGL